MNPIVLIPARGGSKRIPNKNMRPLAGEPLINYTIKFAKHFAKNDKIIVSSDNQEILSHSSSLGIKVIDRPAKLARDRSTTGEVLKHCLDHISDKRTDCIITLQPTNPFRSINDLINAIDFYDKNIKTSKCLCSVSPLKFKYGTISKNVYIPENYSFGQRSQEITKRFYENGQFYITSLDLASQSRVLNESPLAWKCNNWFDLVDIDDFDDLKLASALMEKMKVKLEF